MSAILTNPFIVGDQTHTSHKQTLCLLGINIREMRQKRINHLKVAAQTAQSQNHTHIIDMTE